MQTSVKEKKAVRQKGLAQAKRSKERQCWLLVAPQIIGFFVFSIYPILWSIRYSFYDYDGITATFCGLENIIRVITRDKVFWSSIANTFIIAWGKLIIEIPLALIAALLMSNKLIKGKRVFTVVYYAPTVVGVAASCMIFSFMFATVNGTINNILQALGWIDQPIHWLSHKWSAMAVITIRSIWAGFAANLLYFLAGIANISDDVIEAAEVDGANKVQSFLHVTIPMLAPTIRVILMLAMINGVQMMNDVMLITNGGPANSTNVVMLYIYQQFFEVEGVPAYGYASALGLVTSIILAIMTFGYLRISKKADEVI